MTLEEVALSAELAAEGETLMATWDEGFIASARTLERRWTDEEATSFHGRAAAWTENVMDALRSSGVEVAPYGAEPGVDLEAIETTEGAEFAGCVLAVFRDVEARATVDCKEGASSGWEEVATWNGDVLKLRETERTPAELLAKLEREPGFVCGWWQAREDHGEDAMLEGDPVAHAVACVRERNATGLANYLSWLSVERVHLGDELAAQVWTPAKQHRLAAAGGTWWEWFSFARNATKALQGGRPSASYLRAERERLFWKWTHGGCREGWPVSFGEACERIGLRREAFSRWVRGT